MYKTVSISLLFCISLSASYPPITATAALIWCREADAGITFAQEFPAHTEDHAINTLVDIMRTAKKNEDREKLYAAAYETGLAHSLYTRIYHDLDTEIKPKRTSYDVYCSQESQRYLSELQTKLFALPAWRCYAALHNAFEQTEYKALLYGNKDWSSYHDHDATRSADVAPHLFPTRHLHTPFHDLIESYRPEYRKKTGAAHTELEMTTTIAHNHEGDELYFKSVKQLGQYTKKVQPFFMLAIDAYTLKNMIAQKNGTHLTYNLGMPNTALEIEPAAYKYLAQLPQSITFNLGTLAPERMKQFAQQLKLVSFKKEESKITLLNNHGKDGASLVFAGNTVRKCA